MFHKCVGTMLGAKYHLCWGNCFNSNQLYHLLTLVNTSSQKIAGCREVTTRELVEEVSQPFPNHFGKGELSILRRVDFNVG